MPLLSCCCCCCCCCCWCMWGLNVSVSSSGSSLMRRPLAKIPKTRYLRGLGTLEQEKVVTFNQDFELIQYIVYIYIFSFMFNTYVANISLCANIFLPICRDIQHHLYVLRNYILLNHNFTSDKLLSLANV